MKSCNMSKMSLTVNFGIGSTFSKDSGSAFFEGPVPDPGPLYKVYRSHYSSMVVPTE